MQNSNPFNDWSTKLIEETLPTYYRKQREMSRLIELAEEALQTREDEKNEQAANLRRDWLSEDTIRYTDPDVSSRSWLGWSWGRVAEWWSRRG